MARLSFRIPWLVQGWSLQQWSVADLRPLPLAVLLFRRRRGQTTCPQFLKFHGRAQVIPQLMQSEARVRDPVVRNKAALVTSLGYWVTFRLFLPVTLHHLPGDQACTPPPTAIGFLIRRSHCLTEVRHQKVLRIVPELLPTPSIMVLLRQHLLPAPHLMYWRQCLARRLHQQLGRNLQLSYQTRT